MDMIDTLRALNQEFKDDGFVIDGVFGSYARNEPNPGSDVDLLYHLDELLPIACLKQGKSIS
jgi:predicted nucleotidyltransferase